MLWLRRMFLLTLLALAGGAAVYVQSEGFSNKWRRFVIEQFERRGVFLTLDKLTLDPLEGLVARNIRVFLDKKRTVLLADVDRLHLDLDYGKMARDELFLEGVDLRNADLTFPLDPNDPKSEKLSLRALSARLYLTGDRIEIRKAEGTLFGLQIRIRGTVLRPTDAPRLDEAEAEARRRRREEILRAKRDLIVEAARALKHFESAEAPELDIEVHGDLERREDLNATLRLHARNLRHGTYVCEEIDAVAAYAGKQVDVSRLWVKDHLGEFEAGATWEVGGQEVRFHLRSSADLPGLASAVFRREELREFVFYEPLAIEAEGRLLLGKSAAEAFLPVACVGSLKAGRFATRGEVLDGVEGNFGLSPEGCYFRDVLLRHETGTLGLQAMWRRNVGFRYKLLVQLDPCIFLPFLKLPQTRKMLSEFSFNRNSGIYGELEGEGPEPRLEVCRNHGRVELHNFSYHGAQVKRASADVAFSGNTHTYRNVDVQRFEGRATAEEVHCDDEKHTVRLTGLVSDADPVALTRCFAKETAAAIARYRFDKHPHAEVDGVIGRDGGTDVRVRFRSEGTAHYVLWEKDYTIHKPVGELHFAGPVLNYDVTGILFGDSMSCKGTADLRPESKEYTVAFRSGRFPHEVFGKALPFENLRVTVACHAGRVVYDCQSDLLEGRFKLNGRLDDTRRPQPFSGDLQVAAISFNKFARHYSPENDTEGDLTGHFKFTGRLGDWKSLEGSGALAILNGNLYAVPILGPLTPLLGAMLPRPIKDYNLAREADCTFTVADGFVVTEDIEALTGVFRLVSKGKVDFLEDRIQFEAKAKLRGLPGLVLYPVSEALEYVGEGSVGAPLWRPRYFSLSQEKSEFRKPGEKPDPPSNNPPPARDSRFARPGSPVKK